MISRTDALYRFRLFDVLPVARATGIERMGDGVVVLNALNRIADLNPAAQDMLRVPRSQVLGRDCSDALKPFPGTAQLAGECADAPTEMPPGLPPERWLKVSSSPITDRRGFELGALIVLHDVTDAGVTGARADYSGYPIAGRT